MRIGQKSPEVLRRDARPRGSQVRRAFGENPSLAGGGVAIQAVQFPQQQFALTRWIHLRIIAEPHVARHDGRLGRCARCGSARPTYQDDRSDRSSPWTATPQAQGHR